MARTFKSALWGNVTVKTGNYDGPEGPLAVTLHDDSGEMLAKLSVNMYKPECSHDSKDLPKDCFYAKDWADNLQIAVEAGNSGLFMYREDLPCAVSGFVVADVWQLLPESK